MMSAQTTTLARVAQVARWVARIGSGVFALALIVFAALGSWNLARMDLQAILGLGLLAVGVIALILAWFWELAGGALLLVVSAVIIGIELTKGVVDGGPVTFAVLGVLFVFSWWATRQRVHSA